MNPLELVPYLSRHRSFALASSFGLTLLFVEEGWFTFQFWSRRSTSEGAAIIGLLALAIAGGYLIAFLVPPQLVNASWKYPRAWGILSRVTMLSFAITVATNVAAFFILLYLAEGNLVASYNLLRDVYVYMLVGMVVFHGLLLYVRYLQYLYHVYGAPSPSKVIGTSGGVAILILLLVGFVFSIDLHALELASPSTQGIVGLHTYGRAIYLLTLLLAAYGWHLRWVADH